jgi:hypothetical protein
MFDSKQVKKMKATVIAVARDGGSKLIEYRGKTYFLDNKINSETRGQMFHGNNRFGKKVTNDLSNEIKAKL